MLGLGILRGSDFGNGSYMGIDFFYFFLGNIIFMSIVLGVKKRFWIIEDMSSFGKRRKTVFFRKMLDEGMMLEGF